MSTARDLIRAIVTRVERLDEEIKALNQDKSEVYAEAKANGFDTKALKEVIKQRRKDPSALAEFDALVDLYKHALGMVLDEDGVVRAGARVENIEEIDPGTGEVTDESPATNIADIRPAEVIIREDRDAWDNRLRDFPDIPEELRRVRA